MGLTAPSSYGSMPIIVAAFRNATAEFSPNERNCRKWNTSGSFKRASRITAFFSSLLPLKGYGTAIEKFAFFRFTNRNNTQFLTTLPAVRASTPANCAIRPTSASPSHETASRTENTESTLIGSILKALPSTVDLSDVVRWPRAGLCLADFTIAFMDYQSTNPHKRQLPHI